MGDSWTSYEGFYQGGGSSLNPEYSNFTGYRMSAANLGFSVNPQTANQLNDTINAIKQGSKVFEVSMLVPEVSETIPKQHFAEMRALMKLTGVKPSVHGPMIDAAGFDEKGNWGQEQGRISNERRMFDTIEKAAKLDSNGSIPVVFHSSAGAPGSEFRPGKKEWGEKPEIMERGAMINQETGQVQATKRDYKFRPDAPYLLDAGKNGAPPGVLFSAEGTVGSANRGDWENALTEIAQMNKHAEEIIGSAPLKLQEYGGAYKIRADNNKEIIVKKDSESGGLVRMPDFSSDQEKENASNQLKKAELFLENAELSFNSVFHKAYKYGSDKQRDELKKISKEYAENLARAERMALAPVYKQQALNKAVDRLGGITKDRHEIQNGEWVLREDWKDWDTPQVYKEVNAFAVDKAAETFGNLAMKSYDKLGGDKAPVLAIEPFHPGAALSSTDDLIKLVKKSRKNFAKQLVEKKGFDKDEAKRVAEEKIGVTWDVGHINMIKKYGFTDKDIVEQTKKVSPMVKHVHLTDNFGYADTHLAPGMGNVPIKKIMEQLEKTGRLDQMKKIVEGGGFFQHFKNSPHPYSLAAFGSPIYGMSMGAGWNQIHNIQGSYFGGYGTVNPQTHHTYFGAGFTTMPVELGGQMPGGQSRFGGTPMS